MDSLDKSGQADIEITEEMIGAALRFYLRNASHDEMSDLTARQMVEALLRCAFFEKEREAVD